VNTGPLIIGYDGSTASERALRDAGSLFPGHSAVIVVVWEPEAAYLMSVPMPSHALMSPTAAAVPIDFRVANEIEHSLYEGAQRLAQCGVQRATEAGLDAEPLVVADETSVAAALMRVATERDAPVLIVGAHGHRALRDRLLGSTTRTVTQKSPCPVLVARA
jgi:nucleotide-binding universal stress UspA family protein